MKNTGRPQGITPPAGALLPVQMTDSVSSRNPEGATFATRAEYDLAAGGNVADKGWTIHEISTGTPTGV